MTNNTKHFVFFIALFLLAFTLSVPNVYSQRADNAIPERHFESVKVGLSGYSPVSYHRAGRGVRGSWDYTKTYKDVTYFFTDEDEVKAFEKEPEKYLPQYGGYCTRSLVGGRSHIPNPTCFRVINNKLYLFGDEDAMAEFDAGDETEQLEKAGKSYQDIVKGGRRS
ncbi:MAG: YHS domain-containing (seleno)protein [Planctomycetota bacterium]